MSDPVQQDIRCPRCNAESPFTLWRSLNVTLNPAEKHALIAGELFRFTCPGCGATTQVVYPMLYHDMQRKLMIWMMPDDDDDGDDDDVGPPAESGGSGLPRGGVMDGYTARSVRSVNELLEKILIFDADLDDVALEMVKIIIATQLEAGGQPKDATIHFAQVDRDASGAEQLVFAVVTPTGTRAAALPREPMYSNMEKAAAELASRHPPPGKWPRVDAAYLNRLMDLDISGGPPA
jgi:hypothetical protein